VYFVSFPLFHPSTEFGPAAAAAQHPSLHVVLF
jgi:hypothetical protein